MLIRIESTSLAIVASAMLSFSGAIAGAESLREQLSLRASGSKAPAEVKAKMAQHLTELKDSDLVAGSLKVGDKAPNFTLKDHRGKERSLDEFLRDGKVVLTWYRGGW